MGIGGSIRHTIYHYTHYTHYRHYKHYILLYTLYHKVRSGTLKWGILHTEKFWRENAKFVEGNGDFSLLKDLIGLLQANGGGAANSTFTNPVAVCVALFDIGEFTRFYHYTLYTIHYTIF